MSELRKDTLLDRWVILATGRGERPRFFRALASEMTGAPCPFCPGREGETPEALYLLPDDGPSPWRVRVVPNKYPALASGGDLEKRSVGFHTRMNGVGVHEVIIDTPAHDATYATMDTDHLTDVLQTYAQRIQVLKGDSRLRYIQVFKNHGEAAGATIPHAHTQVIGMPFVPSLVQEEMRRGRELLARKGNCVFCSLLASELDAGVRIVARSAHHVALAPYAARFPFETWVVPGFHSPAFEHHPPDRMKDLAALLKDVTRRLEALLDEPAYNVVLHTVPAPEEGAPYYHWRIEVVPRTTKVAGFEWGTGCYINPMPPEEAARQLRGVALRDDVDELDPADEGGDDAADEDGVSRRAPSGGARAAGGRGSPRRRSTGRTRRG